MRLPKLFASPRILVYLKRIQSELKRANDLTEYRLKLEHPEYRKLELSKRLPKLVELAEPTIAQWNKSYEDDIETGAQTRIEEIRTEE